jgi:peptidoglycan/xylan/chitin deacetylase (PgdA/CDA1 family)
MARRQRRRHAQRRRRRILSVGGLALVIAVVVAIVASAGGSKGGSSAHGSTAQAHPRGGSPRRHGSHARQGGSESALPPGVPAAARDVSAPVLMYHVINPPPAGAPFPGLYVPAPEFSEQMQALAKAGFHAVTLQQLWRHWQQGTPLPAKPVVITFDNGYQSQYSNALPVLRKLGWKAVENMQITGLPPSQGGLSQEQIRGLVSAGWELDTQGFSHAELIALTPSELHYQVAISRQTIQRRYHVPVRWFCYPSGHYNAAVIAAVKEAGYLGSTTVVPGWAGPTSDPYTLPRLRVLGGTSGTELLALIEDTEHDPAPPASYT